MILEELETLEPDNDRWPHLRGDALRKLGRPRDAIDCYERAAQLYADAGFLPRAIAMAKVVLEIDPARFDVLERIDPSAARELHRELRPEGVRVAEIDKPRKVDAGAAPLDPAPETAAPGEARFSNAPPRRRTLGIDITEVELAERAQPSLIPPDDSRREAERQACLPLFRCSPRRRRRR